MKLHHQKMYALKKDKNVKNLNKNIRKTEIKDLEKKLREFYASIQGGQEIFQHRHRRITLLRTGHIKAVPWTTRMMGEPFILNL